MKMKNYVAQKAQQALEELCSNASRKERLHAAADHLSLIASKHFLSSCSPLTKKDLKAVLEIQPDSDLDQIALVVSAAIESIFEESDR